VSYLPQIEAISRDHAIAEMSTDPVVLAYHAIHPLEPGVRAEDVICPPEMLERDVCRLRATGYRSLTAEQLVSETGGGRPERRTAILTFDDGWRDGLTIATPLLRRLGVRATFFVCPGLWGGRDPRMGEAGHMLSESEARELDDAGMELAAHSMTHPDLVSLDDEALSVELRDSKRAVEGITGRPCRVLAYPFGRSDARVRRAAAAAGFALAFSYTMGPWRRLAAPRVARFG
jgi:peptidoglycan/xylan/chitin deacetylase (PgdA/CDA1 family)